MSKLFVNVDFLDCLSLDTVPAVFQQIDCPHIILWYIGCYGLKKEGVEFYKNFVINPIRKSNQNATFWLVDLTAWNAFKTTSGSISKYNSCCNVIDDFGDKKLKCIKSSFIFNKMCELSCETELAYLKQVLSRDFLFEASKKFPFSHLCIGDIFPRDSWISAEYFACDSAKMYSAFQYLEAYFIVEEIVIKHVMKGANSLDLVFLLPNDEFKYYQFQENSFRRDVHFLLAKRVPDLNLKLNIQFISFNFGENQQNRPYNMPGKTLKQKHLTYQDVMGVFEDLQSEGSRSVGGPG